MACNQIISCNENQGLGTSLFCHTLSCWVTLSSWLKKVMMGVPARGGDPKIANELCVVSHAYLLKGSDVFYTPYIFPITTSNQFPLVSPSAWPLSQSVNRKSHKQASKQAIPRSQCWTLFFTLMISSYIAHMEIDTWSSWSLKGCKVYNFSCSMVIWSLKSSFQEDMMMMGDDADGHKMN